ncbi:MAG: hypothetical protein HGB20_05915 [Chlorobiaceae bacterium]|nr:hypothetical protein [Chlorobiaceae bacterium]
MKSCNKTPKWPALFIFACFMIMICFAGATAKTRNTAKNIATPASRWSTENLAVDRYRNGDPIPEVEDPEAWSALTTGAWCYYENRNENGVTYGKLYNWYAVYDPRGLAPAGWHVASDAEWTELVTALGGEKAAGARLKSKVLWKSPVVGADNSSGFSALPAGYRSSNGTFSQLGTNAGFWTSTGENSFSAWYRNLFNSYSAVYRTSSSKTQGFSVRCVKD